MKYPPITAQAGVPCQLNLTLLGGLPLLQLRVITNPQRHSNPVLGPAPTTAQYEISTNHGLV